MTELAPLAFTRGVPADESFPVEEMVEATARALRNAPTKVLQYGPSFGYLPLREWLAEWQGLSVDEVLTSNGSLQIVDFICQTLLQPGDTVFVEQPSYDRTITTLRKYGANIVGIPLEADGPNIAALEAALAANTPKFFYIIPDFQNPAGATCSRAKREQLIALARQHGFLYLEDAPYRPLRYRGADEPSLRELGPDVTLQMASTSKLIGPGPRVGWLFCADTDLVKRIAKTAENTYISPSYLAQGGVYEFLAAGLLPGQIEKLKALYAPRLDATLAALDTHLPDAESTRPDGGFFLSVTLPEGASTDAVRERAMAYNLKLGDGKAFFTRPELGARFLRLPYCAVTEAQLDEGVGRLARVVREVQAG